MQLIFHSFHFFAHLIVLSTGQEILPSKKLTLRVGLNKVGSLMRINAEEIGFGTATICLALSKDVQHAKLKFRSAATFFTALGASNFSDVGPWSKLSGKFQSWGHALDKVESNIEAVIKKQMQLAVSITVIDLADALTEVGTSNGIDSATIKETYAFTRTMSTALLLNWNPKWTDELINKFRLFVENLSDSVTQMSRENWNADWARKKASWVMQNAQSEGEMNLGAFWVDTIDDDWDANWVKKNFIEIITKIIFKKFCSGKWSGVHSVDVDLDAYLAEENFIEIITKIILEKLCSG